VLLVAIFHKPARGSGVEKSDGIRPARVRV